MKKLIILLIAVMALFLLASCGGNGDETADTDTGTWEPVTTDGDTDTGTEIDPTKYIVEDVKDENGKKIGERGYGEDGALRYEEDLDVAGRPTHRVDYNADGNVSYVSDFVFLSGSEPDHYTVVSYEYEQGEVSKKTVTKYNRMSLADSIYIYGGDDALIEAYLYEYSNTGLLTKLSTVDSNNAYRLITEYEYDDEGKVVKETYKKGSGTVASYTVYEYNENGTVSRESSYSPEGELTGYLEYVYDDDGQFVEEIEYVKDEDGNFVPF